MEKKHIITITGSLGSGKSSTSKMVAGILNYKHYSNGDFMRSIATERGMSLEELSKISETDTSVDKALDDRNRQLGEEKNVVVDSRLGFYFISKAFKVLLKLDPDIAAGRILKDSSVNPNRHKETKDKFDSIENISRSITERLNSERKRYKELYNIDDQMDPTNFNLVINTDTKSLEEVTSEIVTEYKKWLTNS